MRAVLQEQEAAIKAIDQDIDFVILELRWDESHVELAIPDSPLSPGLPSESTVAGFFPLVMKKGSIIYRTRNGRTHNVLLILAPVALRESCSADELWRALEQKKVFGGEGLAPARGVHGHSPWPR